ncbi:hypothetical protein chiPu_0033965, partial [Chiloscyllium punctatum]|nr:hypothetical protein [Chiloscyllium punctatum]
MQAHDVLHQVEAEAGAASARMQPAERLQDLLALVGRNAVAIVADLDQARRRDPNQDRAAPPSVVDGVLYQIGERTLDRGLIAVH